MARRTTRYAIGQDGGRDTGKVFELTEMSAARAERWAIRALGAAARSNAAITDEQVKLGLMGIAQFGLRSLLAIESSELIGLLDELLGCVQYVSDPQKNIQRALMPDDADIEEPMTYYRLRDEVFKLHTGFSFAAVALNLASAAFPGWSGTSTSTSPGQSESSSPAA